MDVNYRKIESDKEIETIIKTESRTVKIDNQTVSIDQGEDAAIALTSDGKLVYYTDGQRNDLETHLAWYNADEDTLTALEFVTS